MIKVRKLLGVITDLVRDLIKIQVGDDTKEQQTMQLLFLVIQELISQEYLILDMDLA